MRLASFLSFAHVSFAAVLSLDAPSPSSVRNALISAWTRVSAASVSACLDAASAPSPSPLADARPTLSRTCSSSASASFWRSSRRSSSGLRSSSRSWPVEETRRRRQPRAWSLARTSEYAAAPMHAAERKTTHMYTIGRPVISSKKASVRSEMKEKSTPQPPNQPRTEAIAKFSTPMASTHPPTKVKMLTPQRPSFMHVDGSSAMWLPRAASRSIGVVSSSCAV